MEYERLLIESDSMGVNVKEKPLIANNGLCKGNRIAIKHDLSNKEKYCTLAEELGHYKLTVGDIIDQTKIENRKQEILARRWGYKKLIPLRSFIKAYEDSIHGTNNLAEYFGVTETFLSDTIEYYKCKYGLYHNIDKYILCFEPLGIIEKFIDF